MKPFAATTLLRSRRIGHALELTLADAAGAEITLSLATDLAATLAGALEEAADEVHPARGLPTKMPASFAVGTGKHENVVLVRFEEDAPYGLSPADASELGAELLEQSRAVQDRPKPRLQ